MIRASADADLARILDLLLADLAHPKLYTCYSWAVKVSGFPVLSTDPAAVRWSLHGMGRRHALPDEALAGRAWAAIKAQFGEHSAFEQHSTEEDRLRVVRAAREGVAA